MIRQIRHKILVFRQKDVVFRHKNIRTYLLCSLLGSNAQNLCSYVLLSKKINISVLLSLFVLLSACRNDVMIVPMEDINTGGKTTKSEIIGMYLLNEGNMGSMPQRLPFY